MSATGLQIVDFILKEAADRGKPSLPDQGRLRPGSLVLGLAWAASCSDQVTQLMYQGQSLCCTSPMEARMPKTHV